MSVAAVADLVLTTILQNKDKTNQNTYPLPRTLYVWHKCFELNNSNIF